jgi:hypothetical protein
MQDQKITEITNDSDGLPDIISLPKEAWVYANNRSHMEGVIHGWNLARHTVTEVMKEWEGMSETVKVGDALLAGNTILDTMDRAKEEAKKMSDNPEFFEDAPHVKDTARIWLPPSMTTH